MNVRVGRLLAASAFFVSSVVPAAIRADVAAPPVAPVEPVTDTYGTTTVVDPYRWMEKSAADPRFVPLLKAQNDYRTKLMAPLAARHDALLARLKTLSTGTSHVSTWQQAGGRLFYEELGTSQSIPVLRVLDADGTKRTIFDPATFGRPGSHAAISYYTPSIDGSRVAIGVSLGGSEHATLRVVETATGKLLPDTIDRMDVGGIGWRDDGNSFYYTRLQRTAADAPPTAIYENMHAYLHVIGRVPEADPAVFGPATAGSPTLPTYGFSTVSPVPGTPYLYATYSTGTTAPPIVFASAGAGRAWVPLISERDHIATSGTSQLVVSGSKLYVMLENVPNGRIVSYDLAHPAAPPVVVVPVSEKVIESVFASKNAVYVEYRDGLSFSLVDLSGKIVSLPYAGTLQGVDASPAENGLRIGLVSWTRSLALFRYDEKSNAVADTGVVAPDPSDNSHLVAREVLVPSTDGAQVPVSIIARDDLTLDGSHPTLMEGYGSYGYAIDPYFGAANLEWARRGGVLVFAHLRGGGEYGERWHLAGQKATKQHTVDDMIAAARYLIAQKYTSPQHLAGRGSSAGGIAIGNAIDQHPELFGAAVDNVGSTNLVREQVTPGGPANVPEFGDATIPGDFAYMYPLDAYLNVHDTSPYPAVFGVTGVNDPRVSSWIVLKEIARLQAATSSGKPVVLRADFDAGHGIGSSRTQALEELADEWTFLLWQLGDPAFQPAR